MTVADFKLIASHPALRLRVFASVGPAFAVSIGYMDPGNWATDVAAGAFGTRLLLVIVAANLMAIVMQLLAVRLGGATGEDLATHIASRWPRAARGFWLVAQAAAIATDLAEFSGIVIGLQLLTGISLQFAAGIAAVILVVVFQFSGTGLRRTELFLTACVTLIAAAFVYELARIHPAWPAVFAQAAHVPLNNATATVIAVGIVGATVMPHNLFLHSSLVAERRRDGTNASSVVTRFSRETYVALGIASLVNMGILVVGASLPHATDSIAGAYSQLGLFFTPAVSAVFGGALIVAGIASAVSATVAGTLMFQGFGLRTIPIAVRRGLTLGPALAATLFGVSPTDLMIWSQVGLAFALPVVAVPLLLLTVDRFTMGRFRSNIALGATSVVVACVCIGLDVVMLVQMLASRQA